MTYEDDLVLIDRLFPEKKLHEVVYIRYDGEYLLFENKLENDNTAVNAVFYHVKV